MPSHNVSIVHPVLSAAAAAEMTTSAEEPVFIVGAPRTGSSFLVHALREASDFAGFAEGHLTPLMSQLDNLVVGYFRLMRQQGLLAISDTMIANVPECVFRKALANTFIALKDQLFGSRRWLDKTVNAEAIGALPYVLSVWPRAKIIMLTRDGIANVVSAERYFGVSLHEACRNWASCGEQWDRTRPELPMGSYIEIQHEELIQNPKRVGLQIGNFIGLNAAQLAKFASFVEAETAKWAGGRLSARARLTDLDWPGERLFVFLNVCGEEMRRRGYASKDELVEALARCKLDRKPIDVARAKILDVDSADYFQVSGDGFFIVPGRIRAAMVLVAGIETHDLTHFEAELQVSHPNAQRVRFEFLGIDNQTGTMVFHYVKELDALESGRVCTALEHRAARIDLLIRVVQGISARSNDHAWARISAMCLSRSVDPERYTYAEI
jgi:hypothetical protein